MSRLERYSNPRVIGPGVWWLIHALCGKAVKTGEKEDFIMAYLLIKFIRDNFPCKNCREHIQIFCEKNPIENFKYGEEKEYDSKGLFHWSYLLHSNANSYTGKENEDYDDVLQYFLEDNVCQDCGEDEIPFKKEEILKGVFQMLQGKFD